MVETFSFFSLKRTELLKISAQIIERHFCKRLHQKRLHELALSYSSKGSRRSKRRLKLGDSTPSRSRELLPSRSSSRQHKSRSQQKSNPHNLSLKQKIKSEMPAKKLLIN